MSSAAAEENMKNAWIVALALAYPGVPALAGPVASSGVSAFRPAVIAMNPGFSSAEADAFMAQNPAVFQALIDVGVAAPDPTAFAGGGQQAAIQAFERDLARAHEQVARVQAGIEDRLLETTALLAFASSGRAIDPAQYYRVRLALEEIQRHPAYYRAADQSVPGQAEQINTALGALRSMAHRISGLTDVGGTITGAARALEEMGLRMGRGEIAALSSSVLADALRAAGGNAADPNLADPAVVAAIAASLGNTGVGGADRDADGGVSAFASAGNSARLVTVTAVDPSAIRAPIGSDPLAYVGYLPDGMGTAVVFNEWARNRANAAAEADIKSGRAEYRANEAAIRRLQDTIAAVGREPHAFLEVDTGRMHDEIAALRARNAQLGQNLPATWLRGPGGTVRGGIRAAVGAYLVAAVGLLVAYPIAGIIALALAVMVWGWAWVLRNPGTINWEALSQTK